MFEALWNREPDYSSPAWRSMSSGARDLLHRMLLKDPAKRISAENVLRHPWLQRFAPATVALPGSASSPCLSALTQRAPTESSRAGTASEASGALLRSVRRAEFDDSACYSGVPPAGAPEDGPGSSGAPASQELLGHQGGNHVGGSRAPARVFYAPQGLRPRLLLHGFVDTFKSQVRPRDAAG